MQNLKLAALAILGAGFLGFGSLTSTGCEASATATGGAAGDSSFGGSDAGTAGTGTAGTGTAGTGTAGTAGTGGTGGTGGSGGSADNSATKIAAALKAPAACSACLATITDSITQSGSDPIACTGIVAKCDGDTVCQNLIATALQESTTSTSTNPSCWINKANELVGETATAASDEFYACVVLSSCSDECGNLSNEASCE